MMYRRRPFPIAPASAIAAGELTSGNTIRTSLTFLGPSQSLADTEFRNAKSTRSVASRRLTVRTLCMPLSVPTKSSSLRSDTPRKIPSSHLRSTLATPFVTPRIAKRIFSAKRGSARANLRPLHSSKAVLPSGPLLHLFTIATVYFTSSQDWVSSWKLLSKASDEAMQIRSHGILRIFHSALCQYVANRSVHSPQSHLPISTLSLPTPSRPKSPARYENLCEATANHTVLEFRSRMLVCTVVGTMAAPIQRSRLHLLTKIGAPATSCSRSSCSFM